MKKTLFLSLFVCLAAFASGQPQLNNWFFTYNGINFSSGSPVNIPGGKIERWEGASTISDKNGQLLFYTDGFQVWDRKHDEMPNGFNIGGGTFSSTQSSLIVPKTPDGRLYYIFTADQEGGGWGFGYCVVDMTLNNGYGAVTEKRVQLLARCSEKIAAVRHCNRKDYWLITHQFGTDAYYSFLASDTGVSRVPVISHTGSVIPVANYVMAGELKASPDGKKLIANSVRLGSELSDFDNQTGKVSNAVEIFGNENSSHYGAEFSAGSTKLYLAIGGYWDETALNRFTGIFQYDLSLPTTAAIINSKYQLCSIDGNIQLGILARGPDKKIYSGKYEKTKLSVINNPDVAGAGCNYQDDVFPLPMKCQFSLNNGLNDYSIKDSLEITAKGLCTGSPIQFDFLLTADVNAVLWDFGDPASGAQNNSSAAIATHTYTTGGTYKVKLIRYGKCGTDTASKQIIIGDLNVNLGADRNFCEGANVLLDPQSGNTHSFLWDDGSTAPTFNTSTAGLHWVEVKSSMNSCSKRDSVILTSKPSPFVDLGKDSLLCAGAPLQLNAQNTGSLFRWQDNSTGQTFNVNGGGRYWVEVDLNGCKKSDTVVITSNYKPQFSLGADKFLCPGLPLQLDPKYKGTSYAWQDGTTAPTLDVTKTGQYYVTITNTCGNATDTVNVYNGTCRIYIPGGFTPDNNGTNDKFRAEGTELVTEFSLQVFDRQGQLVFSSADKLKYWDGKLKGMELPAGLYVYLVKYKELNDPNVKMLRGTVVLIR